MAKQYSVRWTPVVGAGAVIVVFAGLFYARSNGLLSVSSSASAEPPSLAALGAAGSFPASRPPAATAAVRFCGSNTVGAELVPSVVEGYLSSKGATGVRRDGSGDALSVSGSLPGDPAPFVVDVRSGGTGTAFTEMSAGRCDVAMASRPATADELSLVGPGSSEHVLGLDGIAIVVNQSSPVSSLTVPQVAALFSGKSPDWSAFGGRGPVELVSYDEKSGTYDTFKRLALAGGDVSPSARRFSGSADVVRAVSSAPGAVAFTSLSSARGVKVLAVGDPGAEPVVPTPWTVGRESYVLTRRLFLYTHSKWTRPAGDSLVLFALSEPGQAAVSRAGFVDLSVKAEQPAQGSGCKDNDCPPEYMKATWGSKRLSVDFRFRHGSYELDSRALADVARVSSFVKPGSAVHLIGFADNSGSPQSNQRLSAVRAEAVKAELAKRGLSANIVTLGLGSAMPIASNDTEEGRQRNRRVEAWTDSP